MLVIGYAAGITHKVFKFQLGYLSLPIQSSYRITRFVSLFLLYQKYHQTVNGWF